jgi:hypothetical protein
MLVGYEILYYIILKYCELNFYVQLPLKSKDVNNKRWGKIWEM